MVNYVNTKGSLLWTCKHSLTLQWHRSCCFLSTANWISLQLMNFCFGWKYLCWQFWYMIQDHPTYDELFATLLEASLLLFFLPFSLLTKYLQVPVKKSLIHCHSSVCILFPILTQINIVKVLFYYSVWRVTTDWHLACLVVCLLPRF